MQRQIALSDENTARAGAGRPYWVLSMRYFQVFFALCLPLAGTGCFTLFNDETQNVGELRAAGENGDREAQGELGAHYYFQGNFRKAAHWLNQSALQGEVRSQWLLGRLHRDGKGEWQKNSVLACQWFILAADQGYHRAMSDKRSLEQSLTDDQIIQSNALAGEIRKQIAANMEQTQKRQQN